MYHTKQGLALFITAIVLSAITTFTFLYFIMMISHLFIVVLLILGIKNALEGKKEPLPLIGKFAEGINL